jgi:hypothetical protein
MLIIQARLILDLKQMLHTTHRSCIMNQTKVQYALIAQKELVAAQEKAALWSTHLSQRLANLSESERAEYQRRAGPSTAS